MLIDEPVRLRALIRALQDVIIPAIPPEAQLAAEQAHLVRRHLSLMLDQADYHYRLQLAELAHFTALLRDLLACLPAARERRPESEPARELLKRATPIAALDVPHAGELRLLITEVREAADSILGSALDAGEAPRRAAAHIVLDYAERQIERERVAVKSAGFDLDAAALPELKDVS
jgi:hypothetical protein